MLYLAIFPFLLILRYSPANNQYRWNYVKSFSRNSSAGHLSAGEHSSIPVCNGSSILGTQGVHNSSQALHIFLLCLQYMHTLSPVWRVRYFATFLSTQGLKHQIVLLWKSSCPNSPRSTQTPANTSFPRLVYIMKGIKRSQADTASLAINYSANSASAIHGVEGV